MSGLILIMIDGIGAEHFERIRGRLPHLDRLAGEGTQVAAVSPEMCGTSSPGRTSIVTGVPAAEHGIYGNHIYAGGGFRWANPWDVKADTLPALATRQGLDVAGIGYGMIRPEDCAVYQGPWWANEMLMGASADCETADQCWLHAGGIFDDGRLEALAASGAISSVVPLSELGDDKLQLGMLADQQLLDIAAGLACSDRPPDLLLTEIAVTDYYLHKYGTDHPLTDWSLRAADAQVGTLLARLERGGVRHQYNIAVLSDHGHAPVAGALYIDRVLGDDTLWSSEGGVLLVRAPTPRRAGEIRRLLAEHGIEEWDDHHLPDDVRGQILTFVMPEGVAASFERSQPGTEGVSGPSKYVSNHGMRPGTRSDYRFCIFSGPDIPTQAVSEGEAIQVAPTLAKILRMKTPWRVKPLF